MYYQSNQKQIKSFKKISLFEEPVDVMFADEILFIIVDQELFLLQPESQVCERCETDNII